MSPPCSTFSVSRFFEKADGPKPVRDRTNIYGLPDISEAHRRELNDANRVVRTDWNSAATSAGVEPWDRVTHVNGKRLKPGALLQDVVGAKDAEVKLTLERLSEDELVERGAQTERNERLSI